MSIRITDVRSSKGDSAFLIDDGSNAVLYDTGFGFTGYAVAENIKKELTGRELDYILLTHSHYDHAMGAPYIQKRFKTAQTVAGEYAANIFSRPSAKALMKELDRKFAEKNSVSEYEDLSDELRVDIALKDGDTVKSGKMCFKAIELTGHTKCSMGYYLESERLLLGTESLGIYVGENRVIPSYLVSISSTLESIEKVKNLNVNKILVPHWGVLEKDEADLYLEKAYEGAVNTAHEIKSVLSCGSEEDAVKYFIDRFYSEKLREIYPYDALLLNTGIMVKLIKKELS